MSAEILKISDYRGYKIKLDGNNRFDVDGPEAEDSSTFDSYNEATAFVDKLIELIEKRTKRKLELPIITQTGVAVVVTGIHGSSGALLTKPPLKQRTYNAPSVYPNTPKIAALIEARNVLSKKLDEADAKLSIVEINNDAYGFRRMKSDDALADLEAKYAKALKEAEAL